MKWLGVLCRNFRVLFRRDRFAGDLEEEMGNHVEMQAWENQGHGMPSDEAHYAAKRQFGNATALRETCRDVWGWTWVERLGQDVRYALGLLRRNPGLSATAVLSLALGIAVNSTIFSVVSALLLRPLPYPDGHRLAALFNVPRKRPQARGRASTGDVLHWRERDHAFEQIELVSGPDMRTLTSPGDPERVRFQFVTPGVFRMLGVQTVLGPGFIDPDLNGGRTALVSDRLWRRRFGADPAIVGRTIVVDGHAYTLLGVVPAGFDFFGQGNIDFWQPIPINSHTWTDPAERWLFAAARLKQGVTVERAQSEMNLVATGLAQAYPQTNREIGVFVEPLQEALFGRLRLLLDPLFGAVAFVLLIACTNVANLLLSSAAMRQQEIGIRASLGAGRRRLVRQMLTESVVLALAGGMAGLALSFWGIRLFVALAPAGFPQAGAVHVDGRVLLFTLAISILTGILFGLAPAWRASRVNLVEALKGGAANLATPTRQRSRGLLVIVEMALALVLLASAGLMVNTFLHELRADPGFDPGHLLTLEVRADGPKYTDPSVTPLIGYNPALDSYFERVVERVQSLPGVESAAVIDWLPTLGEAQPGFRALSIAGRPAAQAGQAVSALCESVSADYFRAMRIPLLKGRPLTRQDTEDSPWVVVINDAMARQDWPHQDPIGQSITIQTEGGRERPREVIGVVGNVRQLRLGVEPMPEMYVSHLQQVTISADYYWESRVHKSVVLRTRLRPEAMAETARRAVADLDRNLAVYNVQPVSEVLFQSTATERFYLDLLGIFAALALLLAAVGIYGVISNSVTMRRHAIGVRMALGARRSQVIWLLLQEGLWVSMLGIAVGVAGSLAATPLLARFLFGVKPHDPLTLVLVSVFLLAIALTATYIPARRASLIDPVQALRHE